MRGSASCQVIRAAAWALAGVWVSVPVVVGQPKPIWLDQPLGNWNKPGGLIARGQPSEKIDPKCPVIKPSTPAERTVFDAGLIPFLNFDQRLVRDDVEIVGGMRGADEMCAPVNYNLFVFVGGRLAGTLSPNAMTSRTDASSGAVRILAADTISAEFARYSAKDSACCPSARMTVRYRLDRSGTSPLVVPLDIRTTRTF
jgi:hypothetical protein